jgi:hypothetical protein
LFGRIKASASSSSSSRGGGGDDDDDGDDGSNWRGPARGKGSGKKAVNRFGKNLGEGRGLPNKPDRFGRAKRAANAEKVAKDEEAVRKQEIEREKKKKRNKRRLQHQKFSQRTSRGQPVMKHAIAGILSKLRKDAAAHAGGDEGRNRR